MGEAVLKRLACQIAAQLPDDQAEALLVLNYAREIILCLGGGWQAPATNAPIPLFSPARTNPADFQAGAAAGQSGLRGIASRE